MGVLITPLLCIVITVMGFTSRKKDQSEGYIFPDSIQVLGWLIELFPIAVILIVALWKTFISWSRKQKFAFVRVGPMLSPSTKWGPRDDRSDVSVGHKNSNFVEDNDTQRV